MKNLLLGFMLLSAGFAFAQNDIPSKESQILTALLAAPEMYQNGAKVLGYNQTGAFVTLREGNNGLVCLADDPKVKGISVACYSDQLEPYMARGRELIAEGKTEEEKREYRKKEIDEGKLKMPSEPAAVYVVTANEEDYNIKTGALKKSKIRYAFYKPYMTVESTGLPTKPSQPGMPWLMDPNTHRSHIMVVPTGKE